ncbi:MAG: PadR family transcriptional regulator [Anaerolineaceae bacterium]|nr:PadR family transcriptional regulator [Anaerolineaceae bacterium]
MSLEYAILGFLTLAPMSGYDLKTRHFDGSVAHFWPANQAQIYRTLDRLESAGLVTGEWEVQTERPNRKSYTITTEGVAALKAWLAESRPLPKERLPFLVQLYFARHLSRDELLSLLQAQRQLHVDRLKEYQAIGFPPFDDPVMARQVIFGKYTLDFGLRYEQMQIEWLDAVMAQAETLSWPDD